MYRMILCAAATLLVATTVRPAAADDYDACLQATGDEAIPTCTRALVHNPNEVGAYVTRALGYVRKREYDRAIADFDQAIRLDPNVAEVYAARGAAYATRGDHDRAI